MFICLFRNALKIPSHVKLHYQKNKYEKTFCDNKDLLIYLSKVYYSKEYMQKINL